MLKHLDSNSIQKALTSDAVAVRIMAKGIKLVPGMQVGVRLNLNVLKNTGVAVQAIHKGKPGGASFYNGEVIGYAGAVVLKNVTFSVNESARAKIAAGLENKFPMASVDGELVSVSNDVADTAGLEVRFNPKETTTFVDLAGNPIFQAKQATVIGHRVFVV